jgi:hypothetical protein
MNDIIIAVDAANDGNPVNETYSILDPGQGKSVWTLDGTSLEDKVTLSLFATPPKRSGNFQGVIRSGGKFTLGVSVPAVNDETNKSVSIMNIEFSIPLGTSEADVIHLCQRGVGFLANAVLMKDLTLQARVYPDSV